MSLLMRPLQSSLHSQVPASQVSQLEVTLLYYFNWLQHCSVAKREASTRVNNVSRLVSNAKSSANHWAGLHVNKHFQFTGAPISEFSDTKYHPKGLIALLFVRDFYSPLT